MKGSKAAAGYCFRRKLWMIRRLESALVLPPAVGGGRSASPTATARRADVSVVKDQDAFPDDYERSFLA